MPIHAKMTIMGMFSRIVATVDCTSFVILSKYLREAQSN